MAKDAGEDEFLERLVDLGLRKRARRLSGSAGFPFVDDRRLVLSKDRSGLESAFQKKLMQVFKQGVHRFLWCGLTVLGLLAVCRERRIR